MEFWKRKQAKLAFEWGLLVPSQQNIQSHAPDTLDYEEEEQDRPGFEGTQLTANPVTGRV